MTNIDTIKSIQSLIGVVADGIWGMKSQAALDALIHPSTEGEHHVFASSFADPQDVRKYHDCLASGRSKDECLAVGDNAVGAWGDSTAEGSGPCCSLPKKDIIAKWGSLSAGKHKNVIVTHGNNQATLPLKDVGPSEWAKAKIDLNPDACALLGISIPAMAPVTWEWA